VQQQLQQECGSCVLGGSSKHGRGGAPLLLGQQERCVFWVLRSSAADLKVV
jgi:hypothetical protein